MNNINIANIKNKELAKKIKAAEQIAINKNPNNVYKTAYYYEKLACSLNEPLKLMIAGEFNTGKSTVINAILGRELLKSDVVPTTSVVTYLCYSEKEYIYVVLKNGEGHQYPLYDLHELTIEDTRKYAHIRNNIASVYVYMNVPILKQICIIDSPGVNVSIERHEENTHSIIDEVDCVIWIMSVLHAGQKSEIAEINKLPENLKPFIVLNKLDLLDPDELDVNEAVNRMGQNIKNYCTRWVAVSGYQALCAYKQNNEDLLEESKFEEFFSILETEFVDKKDEIIFASVKRKIADRRAIISQIPEDKNKEKIKSLFNWLYNNRKIEKYSKLQELLEYTITKNQEIQFSAMKTKTEVNAFIMQIITGFKNLNLVITKTMEIEKNNYALISLQGYISNQQQECFKFTETFSMYTDDNIEWKNVNKNLQILYSNYNNWNNSVDKEIRKLLSSKKDIINQWTNNMKLYNVIIEYEFERDVLNNITI